MSRSDGPKPVADAYAIIDVGGGDNKRDKWIRIGPVWENKDGSQTIVMESEPIEWQSPRCERRIQIRKRQQNQNRRGGRDRDDE